MHWAKKKNVCSLVVVIKSKVQKPRNDPKRRRQFLHHLCSFWMSELLIPRLVFVGWGESDGHQERVLHRHSGSLHEKTLCSCGTKQATSLRRAGCHPVRKPSLSLDFFCGVRAAPLQTKSDELFDNRRSCSDLLSRFSHPVFLQLLEWRE